MKNKTKYFFVFSILFFVFLFGFLFNYFSDNSKISGYATTDSQVGNLSVGVETYMACTWSDDALNVSFGESLDPGTNDINATENYGLVNGTKYNVTVSALSTDNADVTISGNDLVDGANNIAIGNVTWVSNTTSSDGANMVPGSSTSITGSPVDIATGVSSDGSGVVHYRFWLDLPSGAVAGTYVGNYTLTCEQAS